MDKVYTYNIDLDGNSLKNALLHPVESLPVVVVENQVITYDGVIYLGHTDEWVPMGARIGSFQGGIDASTATELPSPSLKGDYWFVEVAGTVNTLFDPQLEVGTMVIAKVDSAGVSDVSDWVVLRTNTGTASSTEFGLIKLASVAETREGINEEKAVTPYGLSGMKAEEADVLNPLQDERFVTPEGLHKLTATETRQGLSRFATSSEVGLGVLDNAKVSPKSIKDNSIEKEIVNIHEVNLLHINLVAPDLSVWKVTVDVGGFLQTELVEGGS